MAVEEKKEKLTSDKERRANSRKPTTPRNPYCQRYKSGFPPNVTVDELYLYRKRRPVDTWPKDNLKIEEGDFKPLKSEYRKRFRNYWDTINESANGDKDILKVRPLKSESSLQLEGSHDFQSEYNESFNKPSVESLTQLQIMDNGVSTSKVPALESAFEGYSVRPPLLKRSTNLKLEGDYIHVTEHAEKFIEYLLERRSELLRTPTTLKLEGDMETKTETREQFIKYDEFERPALCKKLSNLHLEGDYEILTEKQEKFLPYEVSRRPPLTKKSTNLHLEGDLSLVPEYRSQFVEYKSLERPKLVLPVNNLKNGGVVDNQTKEVNFFDRKMHPLIPFLREADSRSHDFVNHRRTSARDLFLKVDKPASGNYETNRSASHPNLTYVTHTGGQLESGVEMKPEYKSSYVDFYKQGRISPSVKMMRQSELNYLKGDDKMDVQAEYSSSYVNFPRRRPRVQKPESHLSSEGETYHVTEKSEKYYPHTRIQRTETCKREPELKLEGRFECQPEYRKAYIDYLIRERRPAATQRRAFALVETNGNDVPKDDASEADTVQENEPVTLQVPDVPKSNANTSTASKDSSSYASSMRSSPRLSTNVQRDRKLSQIETTAFGSRCSRGRRSLTPSPTPRRGRDNQLKTIRDTSPRIAKEGSPRYPRTENLQVDKEVSSSDGNKWSDSVDSDAAFFVLDEKPSKRIAANSLYKEQKWMPSWKY